MEVRNDSQTATFTKSDVGNAPINEIKSDSVITSNIKEVDTQATKTVSISDEAKALLAAESNGSGNEPPATLSNGSGNEPPKDL